MYRVRVRVIGGASRPFQLGATNIICAGYK